MRENTSANPPGATTRASLSLGLPVMRPCSASDVTDSTTARMSRWNTTLQSPFRGSSSRWPTGTMRWLAPLRSTTPSSIGNSAIGRSSFDCGSGEIACDPADNAVSATPVVLRCEAVAWPS